MIDLVAWLAVPTHAASYITSLDCGGGSVANPSVSKTR
jgi:hypothetical protein